MFSRFLNQEYGERQLAKRWQNILSGQGLVTEKKITENKSLFLNFTLQMKWQNNFSHLKYIRADLM